MHTASGLWRFGIHQHIDAGNVPVYQTKRMNGLNNARQVRAIHGQVDVFGEACRQRITRLDMK